MISGPTDTSIGRPFALVEAFLYRCLYAAHHVVIIPRLFRFSVAFEGLYNHTARQLGR